MAYCSTCKGQCIFDEPREPAILPHQPFTHEERDRLIRRSWWHRFTEWMWGR